MKVFLTGATGLVGAHTARELENAGHDLRLLVRDPERAADAFGRIGIRSREFVVADMTDAAAIDAAVRACDAVVHAAAMVDLAPTRADEIYDGNVRGAQNVLGAAVRHGVERILYVSSLSALFSPDAERIDESSPIARSTQAYSRSKADCERLARDLQAAGAPIQITYPAGVFAPDDPKLSESNGALVRFLTQLVPLTSSGLQCVDARDLARVHRFLLESAHHRRGETARYVVAGHFYPWAEFAAVLEQVTGRKLRKIPIPGALFRLAGRVSDVVKHVWPFEFPLTSESAAIVTQWRRADSSRVLELTGMRFRPGAETFRDTIAWLRAREHIPPEHAGRCAAAGIDLAGSP